MCYRLKVLLTSSLKALSIWGLIVVITLKKTPAHLFGVENMFLFVVTLDPGIIKL